VPYFLMELLLDVPYFHSGQETCSSVCHIFMGDLLLGVPYFMVRALLMYYVRLRSCSLACHIFI